MGYQEPIGVCWDGNDDYVREQCNRFTLRCMGWRDISDLDNEMPSDCAYIVAQYDEHICDPQILVAHAQWDNEKKEFYQIGNDITWKIERIDYWLRITPSFREYHNRFMQNAVVNALTRDSRMFRTIEA